MFLLGILFGLFALMDQHVNVAMSVAIGSTITFLTLHEISLRCNSHYFMEHLPE